MGSSRESQVGHLPLEITAMVGRRQETTDIRRLMASQRLVTLVGPGGIGKTRTALHVARTERRTFADGAWFVDLSSVRDSELVAKVVAETLKVPDSSAMDPRTAVIEYLRGRRVLLVLDNCEHLLAETAALAESVLREIAGAQVLVTSRQPLGVPGEVTYRIDPLAVPQPDLVTDVRDLAGYAAVELFATRARAALGTFEVDASNQMDVVRLCAELEGLPLALELAASRLKVMTISELLLRLGDRFGMLKGTSPVASPRHQTLLSAVTWSHDLCTPAEQVLWRRASVFAGSFSLDAAEKVCAAGDLPPDQVLDALLGLVDKSVLFNEPQHGQMRFRMLEIVAGFGADRLAEVAETEALRTAHCAWVSALLAEAATAWFGPRQAEWTASLRLERANIRSALDFCATRNEHARTGQQAVGASWFFWLACDYLAEGRLWLERLVDADTRPSPERAFALGTTAYIAAMQGDIERAVGAAAECEELAESFADPPLLAYAVSVQGLCAFLAGDAERAEELYRRGTELYAGADALDPLRISMLSDYATTRVLRGDVRGAASWFAEVETACEQLGEHWMLSYAVAGRGMASFQSGDLDQAEELLLRSIAMKRPFHDTLGLALAVDTLAWILAAKGDAGRAARLVGVASRLWSTFGRELFGSDFLTVRRAGCEAAARQALGDAAYDDGVRQGAAATLDDALQELVEVAPARRRDPATHQHTASLLTRREREIAGLVARGLTNREIADELVLSTRTVETHVDHVLRKLDFRSRTQIATWFAGDPQ